MRLTLKTSALTAQRDAHGHRSNAALAEAAGINESTLQRLIAGAVQPSGPAIAGLLAALPNAAFEDLFEPQA
ncbi:transcriptional regulator [Actinokineospora globicatena]|nr:transcriptional regulator [Actinokineospora globicatena]